MSGFNYVADQTLMGELALSMCRTRLWRFRVDYMLRRMCFSIDVLDLGEPIHLLRRTTMNMRSRAVNDRGCVWDAISN